jgi:dienelactone hydrolase
MKQKIAIRRLCRRLACAAAVTLAVVGTSAVAAERVQVNSVALTTIADVLGGRSVSTTEAVTGTLTMPATAAGPVPLMVVVADATGMDDSGRVEFWSGLLLGMGVATFVPDSFASRGVEKSELAQREVTPDMRVADAFASLMHFAADPRIDADRIGILGIGAGGTVAVNTAFKQPQRALTQRNRRFALHIALYPACDAQWQLIDPVGSPLHFILAGRGQLHLANRCEGYVERIVTAGGTATATTHPQGFYGFDSNWGRRSVGGLSSLNRCFFRITDEGVLVEVNHNWSTDTLEGRNEIVRQCTSFGAIVEANHRLRDNAADEVRQRVTASLLR